MEKSYTIGDKTFVLDEAKAEEAYAAKKVINGKDTMFFNILPLKYQWAYDLYKTMKNNPHKSTEDIIQENKIIIFLTLSMVIGFIYMNQSDQMIKTSFGQDMLMTEDFYSPE